MSDEEIKNENESRMKKDMCPKCINSDGDGHCITKEEAPFGTFICENGEMFEPLIEEE